MNDDETFHDDIKRMPLLKSWQLIFNLYPGMVAIDTVEVSAQDHLVTLLQSIQDEYMIIGAGTELHLSFDQLIAFHHIKIRLTLPVIIACIRKPKGIVDMLADKPQLHLLLGTQTVIAAAKEPHRIIDIPVVHTRAQAADTAL